MRKHKNIYYSMNHLSKKLSYLQSCTDIYVD